MQSAFAIAEFEQWWWFEIIFSGISSILCVFLMFQINALPLAPAMAAVNVAIITSSTLNENIIAEPRTQMQLWEQLH